MEVIIMSDEEIKNELESIKKLLILQLIRDGASHADVAKAAGMSTKTMYKFVPKNKTKKEESNYE